MAREISSSDDYIDSRDVEERIKWLEESITPRYVAGFNMPGYVPGSEPHEFDNQEDAKNHIRFTVGVLLEDYEEGSFLYKTYQEFLDRMEVYATDYEGDFSEIVGGFCFWVKEDGETVLDEEDQEELKVLKKLQGECEGYSDWKYGETLIRESYWEDYVEELVKDLGYISKDFPWWIKVDWEATAKNVAMDYSTVDFGGVDYYIRS